MPWENIEVVIHPQSTIHSMVEFADGSVKAQLGPPQYAAAHPVRPLLPGAAAQPQRCPDSRLDTGIAHALDFQPMEPERYPCFRLALETAQRGQTYPAVLSAADEVAVNAFLKGQIGFGDIYRVVESVVAAHNPTPGQELAELLEADAWATREAEGVVLALAVREVR